MQFIFVLIIETEELAIGREKEGEKPDEAGGNCYLHG